jgi:hypothetical protein
MTTNARKIPYGWKLDGGKKKVKDTAAQRVIKTILEQHQKGASLATVAGNLNERGIPSPRGGRWHDSTVRNIIQAHKPDGGEPAAPEPETFDWIDVELDEEGHEALVPRTLRADTAALQAQAQALIKLTGGETFQFYEPVHYAFGHSEGIGPYIGVPDSQHGIDSIVAEMTRQRGYDLHQVIDEVKDQPRTKALLRQLSNLLLREISILRQTNLHLRQERAEQSDKLWRLEHPPSDTPQGSSEPAQNPVEGRQLTLKKTVDPQTVKQTFSRR